MTRRRVLVALVAAAAMPAGACTSDEDPGDATSTCDLLPRQGVSTVLALPGQSADDLAFIGGDHDV